MRCGVFVNYHRADAGWAAKLLAETLRRRLGSSSEVFLDTRSIKLGEAFAEALKDGVRRSAVLVVLIGPRWDEPPLVHRLADPRDWVRRELLMARELGATVVPVLVDRATPPAEESLPKELRFVAGCRPLGSASTTTKTVNCSPSRLSVSYRQDRWDSGAVDRRSGVHTRGT